MLDLRSELNVVQIKPTNTALSLAPKEDISSNAIPIKKKQDPMEENSINDKPSSLSTPPNKGQNLFALVWNLWRKNLLFVDGWNVLFRVVTLFACLKIDVSSFLVVKHVLYLEFISNHINCIVLSFYHGFKKS